MDTLTLPPAKTVFSTQYCPTCLRVMQDSRSCGFCRAGKPKNPSRLKRIVQCLCNFKRHADPMKERMLEDLSPRPQMLLAEVLRECRRQEDDPEQETPTCQEMQQCCALCGLARGGSRQENEREQSAADEDSIPLPATRFWQCTCGTLTHGDSHICQDCGRTNRALQWRLASRRVLRSLDLGLEAITLAALLFAGVCRVCGDPTPFGSALCRDCGTN